MVKNKVPYFIAGLAVCGVQIIASPFSHAE
jgi:hypothetical protein